MVCAWIASGVRGRKKEIIVRRNTVRVIVMFALGLLGVLVVVHAQPSAKMPRIGYLNVARWPHGGR